MCAKLKQEAQNPLPMRCHRLMEAFAKSDDERDFYIDRQEGFLIYVDLDKPQEDLDALERELSQNTDRYCTIPKLSFYETKKIMEGFVNEKVYDIDTKEKLLDIIQSKEARENFLEFIYDHHSEQEKWQQYYQERSRIRIIEWLRVNHFHFVFEEDLDLPKQLIEKVKQFLFQPKVGKDILNARKNLITKAKTYYSSEALNPRPKRGRPPKQAVKLEIEPQVSIDIYTTVPPVVRPFLFTPDLNTSTTFSIFSSKFEAEDPFSPKRLLESDPDAPLHVKLASLRSIATKWVAPTVDDDHLKNTPYAMDLNFDDDEDEDDDDFDDDEDFIAPKKSKKKPAVKAKAKAKPVSKPAKAKPADKKEKVSAAVKKVPVVEKQKNKRIIPNPKAIAGGKKPKAALSKKK